MTMLENYTDRFERLKSADAGNGMSVLTDLRQDAFTAFSKMGIPTAKHEEWKYTRIGSLFNKEFQFPASLLPGIEAELDAIRLPGHETANELVFVNGYFIDALSAIRSPELTVMQLEQAASGDCKDFVARHFGHSSNYLKDGLNALNMAFTQGGIFLHVKKGQITEHPVYIYNITDAREANILAQPRSLMHIAENAQVQLVETYSTIGVSESLTNQVMEVVMEKDAMVEYYKIQNDASHASLVSTTHFRQIGKSYLHAVTISLNGDIVRNNLNVVLEAEHCEAHLYGLYFASGKSHIDNHTVVDNVKPNCFSNELYKGILNHEASGVFNGKIFVRPQAQKTNAYQSNKNVLLSDAASINTKPQLEIFADDVKCSHGCTIGQLDEEALFYLRSRGIHEKTARFLMIRAFATDILEHIRPSAIRAYVEQLISQRLEL